ncbi:hypothetical protein D3C87_1295500 [compost metagenome]
MGVAGGADDRVIADPDASFQRQRSREVAPAKPHAPPVDKGFDTLPRRVVQIVH